MLMIVDGCDRDTPLFSTSQLIHYPRTTGTTWLYDGPFTTWTHEKNKGIGQPAGTLKFSGFWIKNRVNISHRLYFILKLPFLPKSPVGRRRLAFLVLHWGPVDSTRIATVGFQTQELHKVDSIILTHEHADAVLGLDDIRAVQPFSPINDIEPTPIFLNQHAVDRKLKAGQEVRCVAQLDWKIIEIRITNCTPTDISKKTGQQLDLLILDTLYKNGSHNTHFCFAQDCII
ncbi:hypothetical protein L2E82_13581 [Cichorium intybus]|uniref:Uncharacterized protein n=1 Tax=Cichorium intybus TaxID=13427 RepID=A0ACB9EXL9_CICIN|nr:hypothetical protein L2E82_13581 [Cichorium intybus]